MPTQIQITQMQAVVEAAQALTSRFSDTTAMEEWYFRYSGSMNDFICIGCDCFWNEAHEQDCPAKALDDALNALRDNAPSNLQDGK